MSLSSGRRRCEALVQHDSEWEDGRDDACLFVRAPRARAAFEHEEYDCASSSACHQAGSPARQWLETLALEHIDLRARIDAVRIILEPCVTARNAVPELDDTEVGAFLDRLAEHELSEAHMFQITALGH